MKEAQEERETMQFLANAGLILAKIQEHSHGERGVQGTFPCPVCTGGAVSWAVSGYNGHRRARCSTPQCCWFFE